jgi:2'-5' RNA ligase
MRLFIAVNFTNEVRDAIAAAIQRIPVNDPPWRWAHQSTWHVTLKFLGDTPPQDVDPISDCIQSVCSRHTSFPLELDSLGGFPNLSRPRVLFYAVHQGKEALAQIAAEIDTSLYEKLGIPKEERPFRAHATVARIKKRPPKAITDKLIGAESFVRAAQTVTSVDLMKSELRPEGARYQRLKEFALPPAA